MRIFFLLLTVSFAAALKLKHKYNPCHSVECRPGRECVVVGEGAQCLCATSCPDNFSPVCGTNGVSYDSHCLLHRHACFLDSHISIHHKGFCKKDLLDDGKKNPSRSGIYTKKLKGKTSKESPKGNKERPVVCFAPQRDTLRILLIQYWEETLKNQPWHIEGMTYRESLWGRFFTCDDNKDSYLTPEELLICINSTHFSIDDGFADGDLIKTLCVDVLVDDVDSNHDWRLSFEEFTHMMDPLHLPKEKNCSLEGESYKDTDEVHVNCNHCVCAVGNWVCTSQDCTNSGERSFNDRPFGYMDGTELENEIKKDKSDKQQLDDYYDYYYDYDYDGDYDNDYDGEEDEEDNDEADKNLHTKNVHKKKLGSPSHLLLDDYYDRILEKENEKREKKKQKTAETKHRWGGFIAERGFKKKNRDHKEDFKNDVLFRKKYSDHENDLWSDLKKPSKKHSLKFLNDNSL